ncbi:MAG TPA: DUF3313 domain-containing protein [Gammaproteobacteria bacterium]|nr:DUF3313 domain-containing protein [Gammaproteobacteria bacterium]
MHPNFINTGLQGTTTMPTLGATRYDTSVRAEVCGRFARSMSLCAVLGAMLLSGCASTGSDVTTVTVTDPTRLTQSGFLSDYKRLETTSWGGGIECWRDPGLDATKYDKILISNILVSLKPKDGENPMIDPSDLKVLTDYFHNSLVNAFKPQMGIVTEPVSGTIVMRIALTSLLPTQVSRSVTGTLIPYGFVAEAGSGPASGRPAGTTPYLGETGMEMQFVDGATGSIVGECRDTELGRKYAAELDSGADGAAGTWASGYVNAFQSWSYAKNAFDKWSLLTAQRFAELQGKAAGK